MPLPPSTKTEVLFARFLGLAAVVIDNPFDMPKLKSDEETREAFSDAELQLIFKEADDFTKPLFAVAIATALREGDMYIIPSEPAPKRRSDSFLQISVTFSGTGPKT